MKLSLHLQIADDLTKVELPKKNQFKLWVLSALDLAFAKGSADMHLSLSSPARKLSDIKTPLELTLRLITEAESAQLNVSYRHKSGPTNVLSFPYDDDFLPGQTFYLGDLAICAPLVLKEAMQQQKPAQAHWAHLTVHGVLHLLGFDHEQEAEALVMEALETQVLQQLGYADPYTVHHFLL